MASLLVTDENEARFHYEHYISGELDKKGLAKRAHDLKNRVRGTKRISERLLKELEEESIRRLGGISEYLDEEVLKRMKIKTSVVLEKRFQ